jgi:hypothetical protein
MEDDDMEYLEAANEDEVPVPPRLRAETHTVLDSYSDCFLGLRVRVL